MPERWQSSVTCFTVFIGTRPEAVKLLPVVRALREKEWASVRVVSTGQHRSLLKTTFDDLGFDCHRSLKAPRRGESLNHIGAWLLAVIGEEIAGQRPDMVIVQGDTTSALAAALAAFHAGIPVAHVEAGLRTYCDVPYPEEMNRQLIARLARLHFSPTEGNKENLMREGIPAGAVFVTGNTAIDEVYRRLNEVSAPIICRHRPEKLLVTAHRRESWGAPMREIRDALNVIATRHTHLSVLFPIHINPQLRDTFGVGREGKPPNLEFIEPPGPEAFFRLMLDADLVLTDSGGLQEEAPALGKPTLVLRDVTERPDAIEAGTSRLVGTRLDSIVSAVETLLEDELEYQRMARPVSPFGDGRAAERITDILRSYWRNAPRETTDFASRRT